MRSMKFPSQAGLPSERGLVSSPTCLGPLLQLVAGVRVRAELLDPAVFLLRFCLPLPLPGLQLIDPLLLSIQLLTRPGKERKNGKKNQLILNGLTKPRTAQA